jgi:hypothetical protein
VLLGWGAYVVATFTQARTRAQATLAATTPYNYQQPLTKESDDPVKIEVYNDSLEVALSLPHMLSAFLVADDISNDLQTRYEEFADLPENDDKTWLGIVGDFLKLLKDDGKIESYENPFNSYNWDNDLDQVLWGCVFDINKEHYIFISPHCGCDVRGGYPKAECYKIHEIDYFWMSMGNLEITCNNPDCKNHDRYWESVYQFNQELGDKKLKVKYKTKKIDGKMTKTDEIKAIKCPRCSKGDIWVIDHTEY